jgi:DNA modification methylase
MSQSVQVQSVPITRLHPAAWNPRLIKDDRFENLCASITADPGFLWHRPVLAQADGTIYAGNMRYRAAQHLGMTTIPAIVEDVPDQLARERALRDNAQWGEWQQDELAELLHQLGQTGSDLDLLGFDDRELQRLLDRLSLQASLGDPEVVPALPEGPVAKPGDLYRLGLHRLLCGDSTNPNDVARVMGDERAACLWTDPPYGVSYVGGTKDALTIKNDDADGLDGLLGGAFAAIDPFLAEGAAIYIAHPAGALSVTFANRFIAQGWRLHETLVWVKDSLVPGHSDYHYRHEPLLFGYKAATGRRGRGARGWYGGNDASSVFEVPRPKASPEHPTSKPVALVEAMVKNSTKSGEIVLDAFLGSGSTLIAAERLGRRCFGIELDARYVDVAVRRWEALTGQKAVRFG